MKKIVISGSVSLADRMQYWRDYFQSKGYEVLDFPEPIDSDKLYTQYPDIHKKFYDSLLKTDIHFIANETKNGVEGYIGPGVFAEISFRIGLNLVNSQKVPILLLTMPANDSFFYKDIKLWESFGWLEIFDESKL